MKSEILNLAREVRNRIGRGGRATSFERRGRNSWLSQNVKGKSEPSEIQTRVDRVATNPLEEFFDSRIQGHGIWKWRHYFEAYDRHLCKFRSEPVRVLEIGIYSGGSLEMWRNYFGPSCRVYGVDIEPACKAYENEHVEVFIGDQADRAFWRQFRSCVDGIDILIDDGGHQAEQQIVTVEEMLPFIRPGGVYICEDIHRVNNDFAAYIRGVTAHLNTFETSANPNDSEQRMSAKPTEFQAAIHSIHLYPFMAVIEKRRSDLTEFVAPKHGTLWQPFLS